MVLLQTGWSRRIKETTSPLFPPSSLIVPSGSSTKGSLCLELNSPLHVQLDTLVHRMFLSAGIIIVEGLTNLDLVPNGGLVAILPLRLMEADGAPVRAVCILED